MNKIKFGVVGFGNIGKRHVQHILNNEQAQLVAICDEKTIEEKIEGVRYFTSIDAMLQDENIDVVNVCTPNYLHHPHTMLSLQYKKHVVCEKPMAISVSQCNEMIEAAIENEKTIFVVKQNRFNEPVQQVKKLMNENVLGNIYFINVNCFWNRNEYYYNESNWRGKKELDGGCLFTQFSHFIDILYYLFGEIKNVQGLIKNLNHAYTEVEDSGSFVMETMNGAIVNFNFSTCSFEKNMEGAITILAENGTVKIGGQYLNTIEYQHIKAVQLPEINIVAKSNDYGKYQGSMSNHDKIIANVINTLQGKDTIMTNASEGMQVVQIIEEMYRKSI
jgi:predicted dehydrogenase